MAARLAQMAVERVGGQGLNTEISPFQQATDFALRADNCVIDRVGRLASREAFADYVNDNDFEMTADERFDVVRITTLEPDQDFPTQEPIDQDPESLKTSYLCNYNQQRKFQKVNQKNSPI